MYEFFFSVMALFEDTLAAILANTVLSLFAYFIVLGMAVALFTMLTRKTRRF